MKKTDKQLLFERMEAVNPDFKAKINENINFPRAIDKIKTGFNIQDWDSEEGIAARNKIAKDLGVLYTKLMNAIKSTVSDVDKAKLVKNIITGSMYGSVLFGLWNVLHPDIVPLVDQDFSVFGKDFNVEFGERPDFTDAIGWGKMAIFLFLIRFVHGVLVKGVRFMGGVKNLWHNISGMFKKLNEDIELNEEEINWLHEIQFSKIL